MLDMFNPILALQEISNTTNYTYQHKGFIYIVKDPQTGYIKIGRTKNRSARKTSLNTGRTLHLTDFKWFPCDNTVVTEKEVHKILADSRVIGEWFKVSTSYATKIIKTAILQCNKQTQEAYMLKEKAIAEYKAKKEEAARIQTMQAQEKAEQEVKQNAEESAKKAIKDQQDTEAYIAWRKAKYGSKPKKEKSKE